LPVQNYQLLAAETNSKTNETKFTSIFISSPKYFSQVLSDFTHAGFISTGRSTHCAFYHWRPHLSSDFCIGLEQFARVSPVITVVASFPQQTEKPNFLPGLTDMTKNVSLR